MNTHRPFTRSALFVCTGILIVGFFTALFFIRKVDREQQAALLQETQYAALLVHATDVDQLTGTNADIGTPTYERLKSQFMMFRSLNPRIRFVYLMGYDRVTHKQFFYVDSEPITSSDYSPPGQIFEDTKKEDIDGYLQGKIYTTGPYTDSWGEWISGNAPIKDESGQTAAVVGIDIATTVWRRDSAFIWITVGSITLLLCMSMVSLLARMYRKQRSIDTLTHENRSLTHSTQSLAEIQTLAQLGKITFYFKEKTVSIADHFKTLFKNQTGLLTFAQFFSSIHQDDQHLVTGALEEVSSSAIKYSWFDARIGSVEEGYRTYHFYGNIDRGGDGTTIKFVGIMQDITDIQK